MSVRFRGGALFTPPPQRQQPQSAVQFLQSGRPPPLLLPNHNNRQSSSVAPSQQPQRQQSNGIYRSSLASHYQILHNTPALNAVPPQFRQLQHIHSTSELLVNPHVQQVRPRRNDQIDNELLELIDRIVNENRGESNDPLEARQPLAIVSIESVAVTSTTPYTSQAGSVEAQLNPTYPFGKFNLRQIKQEVESHSQALQSTPQLPTNPSSITKQLSAEMHQYLRSDQQQMPAYQAPRLFRPGFDSNPFNLVHDANLMHVAGTDSSDMPSLPGLKMQVPIVTSSSSSFEDQNLCAVCNDHAICQHYGARRRGRLPSKAKTSVGSQQTDQPPSPPEESLARHWLNKKAKVKSAKRCM
uniref:Uncharacterized protein n=1 Tax=Acrobeloides nanus TaxID=290746 RepID=A0A914D1C5_9BILA